MAQDKFLSRMKVEPEQPLPEQHFHTYSQEEVIAANGALSCAECDCSTRALKLDVEDDGEADLYCEPCWIDFYGFSFAEHESHLDEGGQHGSSGMTDAEMAAAEVAAQLASN